ncbi:uncharacterized protein LOC127465753 [Manacus candei]|uniref:uncharacterized protein LOC127465753 n=1 Tax=Manacus candei TaxID=415023 RepID=UPI00222779EC|nr:uncharacterized protein LOC127465753 [Manacus candei]
MWVYPPKFGNLGVGKGVNPIFIPVFHKNSWKTGAGRKIHPVFSSQSGISGLECGFIPENLGIWGLECGFIPENLGFLGLIPISIPVFTPVFHKNSWKTGAGRKIHLVFSSQFGISGLGCGFIPENLGFLGLIPIFIPIFIPFFHKNPWKTGAGRKIRLIFPPYTKNLGISGLENSGIPGGWERDPKNSRGWEKRSQEFQRGGKRDPRNSRGWEKRSQEFQGVGKEIPGIPEGGKKDPRNSRGVKEKIPRIPEGGKRDPRNSRGWEKIPGIPGGGKKDPRNSRGWEKSSQEFQGVGKEIPGIPGKTLGVVLGPFPGF